MSTGQIYICGVITNSRAEYKTWCKNISYQPDIFKSQKYGNESYTSTRKTIQYKQISSTTVNTGRQYNMVIRIGDIPDTDYYSILRQLKSCIK